MASQAALACLLLVTLCIVLEGYQQFVTIRADVKCCCRNGNQGQFPLKSLATMLCCPVAYIGVRPQNM